MNSTQVSVHISLSERAHRLVRIEAARTRQTVSQVIDAVVLAGLANLDAVGSGVPVELAKAKKKPVIEIVGVTPGATTIVTSKRSK